jgi:hypothetical protein
MRVRGRAAEEEQVSVPGSRGDDVADASGLDLRDPDADEVGS